MKIEQLKKEAKEYLNNYGYTVAPYIVNLLSDFAKKMLLKDKGFTEIDLKNDDIQAM